MQSYKDKKHTAQLGLGAVYCYLLNFHISRSEHTLNLGSKE